MKLNPKLAQSIVDRTKSVVDYVINIMDSNAIIIASTNIKRIGEFHPGAKRVLDTNNHYIMEKEEAEKYPNIVPGISLPLRFHNEILGVVGISNSSKSAVSYGKFLQFSTELLLEQAFLKEELILVEHARDEFLRRLLQDSWINNEVYFKQHIILHNFDINQAYLIITVELSKEYIHNQKLNDYDSAISQHEKTLNTLSNTLNYRLHYDGIFNVHLLNNINFLIPYNKKISVDQDSFIEKVISDLDFVLSQTLQSPYIIGIGGIATNMTEIHKQYRHAVSALQISKITGNNNPIVSFADIYTEYMLLSISENKRKEYYYEIIGPIINQKEDQKKQWMKTLESFFDNNRSLVKTSEQLFIHRNSLLFRLNRIYKLTGLNPLDFKDSTKLYIATILWNLDTINKTKMESLQNP